MLKKLSLITLLAIGLIIYPKIKNKEVLIPVVSSAITQTTISGSQLAAPEFIGTSEPELSAKAAIALDLTSDQKLFSKNPDERLPIASLTKLMTAMVVLDKVSEDKIATVAKEDTVVIGSKMGLVSGEQMTVKNLLFGLLVPSSNDAAMTLARFAGGDVQKFVDDMNAKAIQLKLANTHYDNPVGLDSSQNYSTVNDLVIITREFLKYDLLEEIVATTGLEVSSVDGKITHRLHTSNKLLLENSDVVGVKTGFTSDAQGNLVIKMEHASQKVLTVVLNTPNREDDSRNLLDWIFKSYRW